MFGRGKLKAQIAQLHRELALVYEVNTDLATQCARANRECSLWRDEARLAQQNDAHRLAQSTASCMAARVAMRLSFGYYHSTGETKCSK